MTQSNLQSNFQIELLRCLAADEQIQRLLGVGAAAPFAVGLPDSFVAATLAAQLAVLARPVCLVVPDAPAAQARRDDILSLLPVELAPQVLSFPAVNLSPVNDFQPEAEILTARVNTLSALLKPEPTITIVPAAALLNKLEPRDTFAAQALTLAPGTNIELETLAARLVELGYTRETMIDTPGTFACRGGIADIFPIGWDAPVRLDFFDTELESMRYFDTDTQRSGAPCTRPLELYPCTVTHAAGNLLDYLSDDTLLVIDEAAQCEQTITESEQEREIYFDSLLEARRLKKPELTAFAATYLAADDVLREISARPHTCFMQMEAKSVIRQDIHIDLKAASAPSYVGQIPLFAEDLAKWRKQGRHIFFCAGSRLRAGNLRDILSEYDYPEAAIGICAPSGGFDYPAAKLIMLTERELLGKATKHNRTTKHKDTDINAFVELKPGDYVVHTNHGVGRFVGIERVTADSVTADYLKIEYAAGDKLFIPVEQMHLVQKYIGSDSGSPRLNRLGGNQWEKTKAKVRASVQDMADELLRLYAAREQATGFAFSPDTNWQREFEDAFEYEETPGQLTALEEIKRDMQSTKPMDRLLCGDVGYGKTELAMRAAFKAVQDGKQVAMLAPTTLLAEQHYNNFCARFANYPVNIVLLSRFVTAKQQKAALAALADGSADILIGTHRLLSKDVKFKSLGLLLVDEEQRFGVAHKEKIKQLKGSIDVLTLSATPIPRTLHMSLVGMRDMSVITTPPKDRLPVETYVVEHNKRLIKNAIEREIARGGQVYYIFNSVKSIIEKQAELEDLIPGVTILAAHGQMTEAQLKPIMTDFLEGRGDILLCTTIAESGLDIPNVNTLIVENAENFGLAQLYQLRGRVGRAKRQAYAYFTYRPGRQLPDDARRRLSAIRDFTQLGAGFKIAMRDLEIRGAGNLLGAEQHGHIAAVGFDMYCKLVNEAIEQGLGEAPATPSAPDLRLDLGIDAYIPDSYIAEGALKFEIYNKIAAITAGEDTAPLLAEIAERFGPPPRQIINLFGILQIRNLAQAAGAKALTAPARQLTLNFGSTNPFDGQAMLNIANKFGRQLRFVGKGELKLTFALNAKTDRDKITEISAFLAYICTQITKTA